jgi:hydroxyethylthiazole kinase-like uncharacterized protein yjeF
MRLAYDVESVRAAEWELMAQLPAGALMQRAAACLAASCVRLLPGVYGCRVALLVGSGDNGGDALYAGARLARRGAHVDALLLAPDRTHPGGLAALRSAGGRVAEEPDVLAAAGLVLDGIIGIGGRGGLRPEAAELASRAAASPALVVAVDVPSGVDAATGEVAGAAMRADVTVTFGALKPGLLIDPGASYAGAVELVDIGLAPHLRDTAPVVAALQSTEVAALLPRPAGETDKYRRGVLGVVAGSETYTGAAVLTVGGALRGGAGMVRFASTGRPVELVRQRWPEALTTVIKEGDADGVLGVGRVQAWVVGPGLSQQQDGYAVLAAVLGTDLPVLVDADGLNLLAEDAAPLRRRSGAPTLLTPHAGELSRLLGVERSDIEARRLEHVREAAARFQATVLLKGLTTVVAAPGGGPVRINPTGTSWLGTAGSGDVLSGLAGALLAGGLSPLDAGSVAAYLHGVAGRLAADGDTPIMAGDLLDAWPAAVRTIRPGAVG